MSRQILNLFGRNIRIIRANNIRRQYSKAFKSVSEDATLPEPQKKYTTKLGKRRKPNDRVYLGPGPIGEMRHWRRDKTKDFDRSNSISYIVTHKQSDFTEEN